MTQSAVKRLSVDLTTEEHRQLKSSASLAGMTMTELVLGLLRREGLIGSDRNGR